MLPSRIPTLLLCVIGLSATGSTAYGQEPTTYARLHWTTEDGLPVNTINDVIQTTDGFVWIATYDGLARFDGAQFTPYRASAYRGLSSNRIVAIVEDPNGSLWLLDTQGGLVRYHEGRFVRVNGLGKRDGLVVYDLEVSPDGHVWFGTNYGLARAAGVGAPDSLVLVATAFDPVVVRSLAWADDGAVWLGTLRSGLIRMLPTGEGTRYASWADVRHLYRDEDGDLRAWSAESSTDSTGSVLGRLVGDAGDAGTSFRAGRSWRDHFRSVGPGAGTWTVVGERTLKRGGRTVLETRSDISAVMHDREGNTWVGTRAHGLHQIRPSGFRVIGPPEGLALTNTYTVFQDRSGAVWAGGHGPYLNKIVGDTITTHTFSVRPFSVFTTHQDRAGTLWVGGNGLCALDTSSENGPCSSANLPRRLRLGEGAIRTSGGISVRTVHEDRSGQLWAGTHAGLYRRPSTCRDADCWDLFGPPDMDSPRGAVRVIHESGDGTLWMGTNGEGLVRYTGGAFDTLSVARGLPSGNIRAIHEDDRGVLWVGTEDAGLLRIDPRGVSDLRTLPITTYGPADGLFDDVIHQIIPDSSDAEGERFWMSTNRGLFSVLTDELEAFHRGEIDRVRSTSYTERHGLRNREFNGGVQTAGMRDSEGRLWFPTQEGVVVFMPAELYPDTVAPLVSIERLASGGTGYPFTNGGDIELGANERAFEVTYAAPSFVDPERVRFLYRLEGFDDEWVDAGTRRTAFYTNVPAGSYTFRVRAQNAAGVWSETAAAGVVTVAPLLYERWWTRLIVIVALIGGAVLSVRRRFATQRAREAELQALVAERTRALKIEKETTEAQAERLLELDAAKSRFFANVSHEFRTPLTLTIGPLEDLRDGLYGPLDDGARQPVGLALRNARRVLNLINELLDIARLDAQHLRLQARRLDLRAFAAEVANAFAPLAERLGIVLAADLPEGPVWVWADREALDRVLSNLLSNAFKFTPAGGAIRVRLTVAPRSDGDDAAPGTAVLTVADSGPGIAPGDLPRVFDRFYQAYGSAAPGQASSGIGLALAKELTELHGGTIEAASEPGRGATLTVRLPIGHGHLTPEQVTSANAEPDGKNYEYLASNIENEDWMSLEGTGAAPVVDPEDGEDRPTLLIADDHAGIRTYVRRHFRTDYRILEAADGAAALALARKRLPDLVISDVMMPVLDGVALCRALKDDPATDFLPVVLLTAKAGEESKLEGLGALADDYVTKPFNVRELAARIENLIRQRRRLRERFGSAGSASGDGAPPPAPPPGLDGADAALVEAVRAVIEEHLEDEDFEVEDLVQEVGVSRSSLYRRLKDALGETPQALLRKARLARAARLLGARAGNVSEVAYAVGFKSLSHFSRVFREAYGVRPSSYAETLEAEAPSDE